MKKWIIGVMLFSLTPVFGQIDSTQTTIVLSKTDSTKSTLVFSGYVETYYSYDLGKPDNHNRPGFMYSHNRHNEFSLNLGYIKAAYQSTRTRANLAIGAGSYMNANLSAEPNVLKNIYEANGGVKISKNKEVWIDAGIMSSHIGYESAIGKDNWTLTRTISAENSPYFETGAKISFTTKNEKWFLSALVLNGWQRMQRVDGNSTLAFGHQLTYKPNAKVLLNSSSIVCNDQPDTLRKMRYFHNLYGTFELSSKVSMTAGFDIGVQQKTKGSSDYDMWFAPSLITKFTINNKNSLTLRLEYFDDQNGVIIATGTANGFKTYGYSLNYDYAITKNVNWRLEARGLTSQDKIFVLNNKADQNNYFLTTSLTFAF